MTKVAGWERPGVEKLVAQLAGTDPDAACNAALELGDRREYGAVPTMLEILGATADAGVRNGIAYALSAMRIPETFEVIVDLLQQDRTHGARGTLLYALRPFDCAPILPLLVHLVVEDTWEAAREAAYLISEIEVVSAETWDPLKDRLQMAYEADHPPYAVKDPERRDVMKFWSNSSSKSSLSPLKAPTENATAAVISARREAGYSRRPIVSAGLPARMVHKAIVFDFCRRIPAQRPNFLERQDRYRQYRHGPRGE